MTVTSGFLPAHLFGDSCQCLDDFVLLDQQLLTVWGGAQRADHIGNVEVGCRDLGCGEV